MFDFPCVCEEAGHDTSDTCVAHQLTRYMRLKGGGELPYTKEQLAEELRQASLHLYEDDPENEDLLECPGFTASSVMRVCESYNIPIHVKWGKNKIESFIPEKQVRERVSVRVG
jgi:hypothetical protein